MKLVAIIAIIALFWSVYVYLKNKNAEGRRVSIKPIRANSNLAKFGNLEVTLGKMITKKRDGHWFPVTLDNEVNVSGETFDFLMVKVKSQDDKINRKKGVVCHIEAGHTDNPSKRFFIDWGSVKRID